MLLLIQLLPNHNELQGSTSWQTTTKLLRSLVRNNKRSLKNKQQIKVDVSLACLSFFLFFLFSSSFLTHRAGLKSTKFPLVRLVNSAYKPNAQASGDGEYATDSSPLLSSFLFFFYSPFSAYVYSSNYLIYHASVYIPTRRY